MKIKIYKKIIVALLGFILFPLLISGQVRIRIFAAYTPESAVFTVTEGEYEIKPFAGNPILITKGDIIIISKFNGKIALRTRTGSGIICDSLLFSGKRDINKFSLRVNGINPVRQFYSGDLQCLPDFGTLLFINICDNESYIAGVVRAEGGLGKDPEYFKTQAIIVRTYLYKYFDKHFADRFNLCDNTHCQAFNGFTTDTLITRAAVETKGLVILGPDSSLIISAFHSNCGGETSPSEDVWLTSQPYLRKITDPYCLNSRNALWQKSMSAGDWTSYMKKNGYTGPESDFSLLNFSQSSRKKDYNPGSFSIPLRKIREDMNLRSSFFSVTAEGDSVILNGKGYGHGVGLCQEGAMVMASSGYNYKQIIEFYYTGVRITDIKNAVAEK